MDLADGTRDVVDPQVRAYVSSLVTAVSLQLFNQNDADHLKAWRQWCRGRRAIRVGRRCFGMSPRYQEMVETPRRPIQQTRCRTMSGRIKSRRRRLAPNPCILARKCDKRQTDIENRISMSGIAGTFNLAPGEGSTGDDGQSPSAHSIPSTCTAGIQAVDY